MTSAAERNDPWIIGVTGASGTVYGRRLISTLAREYPDLPLEIIISDSALRVMHEEEGLQASISRVNLEDLLGFSPANVKLHSNRNIGANIASGSYRTAGMVVAPCSMKTLAGIACGFSENLIMRAAEVTLKEQRPLVLVPRETPLSAIQLENMLKLAKIGVRIVPAMPGFYHGARTLDELIDNMVMRIADQMGFRLKGARWSGAKRRAAEE